MLINIIPLLEAQGSSEIENIVTTTDKLFQYAYDDNVVADHATKEALRYRTALYQGVQAIKTRPLTAQTALDVCQTIKGVSFGIRTGNVQLQNSMGQVIYTPPDDHATITALLNNWEQFLHVDDDLDPLVKLAFCIINLKPYTPILTATDEQGELSISYF